MSEKKQKKNYFETMRPVAEPEQTTKGPETVQTSTQPEPPKFSTNGHKIKPPAPSRIGKVNVQMAVWKEEKWLLEDLAREMSIEKGYNVSLENACKLMLNEAIERRKKAVLTTTIDDRL